MDHFSRDLAREGTKVSRLHKPGARIRAKPSSSPFLRSWPSVMLESRWVFGYCRDEEVHLKTDVSRRSLAEVAC